MGSESIYESKFGLKRVINASGRMTHLGGSLMAPEIMKAMTDASHSYVEMNELRQRAGEIIAGITGAEAAYVTSGAAAGIAIATTACITGKDLTKIGRLPNTEGLKNEVIIQRGHMVFYEHMIRMAGAKIVEVGNISRTLPEQIEGAINENTVAIAYVVSHHCVQKGMVSLEKVIEIAKGHNVPIIVDVAAEFDLKKYIAMGADLVIYSGGKEIEGPNCSGFICGRKDLIKACALQWKGIGRAMKIGKEEIVGLIVALERHAKKNIQGIINAQNVKVEYMIRQLADLPHVDVKAVKDEAGRPITRVQLTLDEKALDITAYDVINALRSGDPIIEVRGHYANLGVILIDPRPLRDGDEKLIVKRLKEVLTRKLKKV